MNFLVLIPVVAYVALHFVKVRALPGGMWKALTVWFVLFLGAAAIFSHLPARLFYPDNAALRTVASELYRLSEKPLKDREVVLIVEGSSAVDACVKGRLLERLLREKKIPARVVQLSVPGSNHFERLELLREWLARLTPAQTAAFRKARVILLREVLYTYDFKPLSGFAENSFGDRSIAYTTPANFLPMLRTAWLTARAPDSAGPSIPLISAHFLFNVFRVGAIPPVVAPKIAYSNLGPARTAPAPSAANAPAPAREGGFDYATDILDYHAQLEKPGGKPLPPRFPWQDFHERALQETATDSIDAIAFLAPPQISVYPRKYARRYLGELPPASIRFDGGDDAVLAVLDRAEFWRDRVHVTPAGAAVFTQWLAEQIAADWPRLAGQPD